MFKRGKAWMLVVFVTNWTYKMWVSWGYIRGKRVGTNVEK